MENMFLSSFGFILILVCGLIATNIFLVEDVRGFQSSTYPRILTSRSNPNAFLDKLFVPEGERPIKFFWSGFGVPYSAEVAAEIATYHNGVTLEMILEWPQNVEIKQQMCQWPSREDISPTAEACRTQWRRLSQVYAEKARGPVTPIVGNYLSPTSVWMTHEKPALMTSTQKGNYVYGYQNTMDLYTVYCVKMAQHRTSYPEVKAQICNK